MTRDSGRPTKKHREYHFNVGNTSVGPLGMCAVVQTSSRRQAVEILRKFLPDTVEISIPAEYRDQIDYINV